MGSGLEGNEIFLWGCERFFGGFGMEDRILESERTSEIAACGSRLPFRDRRPGRSQQN